MGTPHRRPEWDSFHPLVAEWFVDRFTTPTEIQSLSWPRITAGSNVLLTAPTGTGKTLAVFLPALDRLLRGAWQPGATKVLYISPLKALNNDIRVNLTQPLYELRSLFEQRGERFPPITAAVRSGDTSPSDRQRMLRKPPEILITTPESLNLILSSPRARSSLCAIETVILDEIHAVAAGKRGTHLITAVERLTLLAGEFQRIAVSATVRPLEVIADFVGGYRLTRGPGGPIYEKRAVEIVEAVASKKISIEIEYPIRGMHGAAKETVWEQIARPVRRIIKSRSSTLVFVNSRRLAENLTHIINDGNERVAYAHHGSLSREIRHEVEKQLKSGKLSAIVATASLEMGIDIGDLDQVILIQTPFTVSQAVQRIGRAGHSVHQASMGILYPSHGMDLVRAAVMSELIINKSVEAVRPVSCPLDVLCQVLISMLGISPWDLKELYDFIRTAAPFHDLSEKNYRSVVQMLAGRYRETRIRELDARITIDRVSDSARARKGALLLLYSSGGTIPDRGYYALRIHGSEARIGELDEEFVWERKTGDTFTLGTQSWKITKIDHQKVEVLPWRGPVKIQPFWKGETAARDSHFSLKILEFLEYCSQHRGEPRFADYLKERYNLNGDAAGALVSYLSRQVASSGAELPHRRHILIEHCADPSTAGELYRTFVHTLWGNRVNYPLSLVLGALFAKHHLDIETICDNDLVMMQTPGDTAIKAGILNGDWSVAGLLRSIDPQEIDDLIRQRLDRSGYFAARFRENAGRALLLPRAGTGKRTPLWVNRLKATKLMEAVHGYRDFPILLETWRACIRDEFDLEALKQLIEEVRGGEIEITEVKTERPSPFAENSLWQATNSQLYGDDVPARNAGVSVDENILREAVFTDGLRPELERGILDDFERRVRRTEPGYAPADAEDLIEWIDNRLLIPVDEWDTLIKAINRDHGIPPDETVAGITSRCCFVVLPGAAVECVTSVYAFSLLCEAFGLEPAQILTRTFPGTEAPGLAGMVETLTAKRATADMQEPLPPEQIVGQWLGYYGPVSIELPSLVFGKSAINSAETLSRLVEAETAVIGRFTKDAAGDEICDVENFEKLLAFGRRSRRRSFEPLPAVELISFLASWQGVGGQGSGPDALKRALAPLFCFPAAAHAWEEQILPARVKSYRTDWLDELLSTTDLEWTGCGEGRIAFCFPEDRELFQGTESDISLMGSLSAIAGRPGRYSFWDLKECSGLSSSDLTKLLWELVWKGMVRCDSYEILRNGILQGFKPADHPDFKPPGGGRRRRRSGGPAQWRISRPMTGSWYPVLDPSDGERRDLDPLEQNELDRDRVRLLLARYGVIFRELLAREAEPFRWGRLFRTMRLMELAGEIIGGYFFDGVPGIQFALPACLRMLREKKAAGVFLLNAGDPASLCGVDLPALKDMLPERFPSTCIVYKGNLPIIVARKHGGELDIALPPDDGSLPQYITELRVLTRRSFNPLKAIKVRRINGGEAVGSRYGPVLEACGFLRDYRSYTLWAL